MDARALLQPFVRLSAWRGLQVAGAGAGLAGIVAYLALASRTPGLALVLATLGVLFAVLAGVLTLSPVERKITLERQAEVVGYRLLLTLLIYFGVGFLLLWGLNNISPRQARVPIAWDAPMTRFWQTAFMRRVTFWPFYALVLAGCHTPIPTPPGAC